VDRPYIFPAANLKSGIGRLSSSANASGDSGGNLAYRGGPVQHDPVFYAVFWLPAGTNYEPGLVNGDTGYENLMSRYLQDAGSTNLANVVSQYYDTTSGYPNNIAPGTRFGGAYIDTAPYPRSGSSSDPLLDSDIRAEVNRALAANPLWTDGVNSTFFVFTGWGINNCMSSSETSCTPGIPSSTGYCGYHNYFTDARSNGAVYAYLPEDEYWNLNNVLTTGEGCHTTNALPNGDIYADNEFDSLTHEQWEATTDPIPGSGWTDSIGNETADKCNDAYGYQPYFGPSNFDVNGHLYYLQEEWSNAENACGGSENGASGFLTAYGPYFDVVGTSTGTLNLAQTAFVPSVNVLGAPNPVIDWGDGTTSEPGGDTDCPPVLDQGNLYFACTLTGSHTYAFSPTTGYPQPFHVEITYYTGFAISYTQSVYIELFAPPPAPTPLAITADNQTMSYGGTVPNFTASYSGLINGDSSSVISGLTCGANDSQGNPVSRATPAGTYPITCGGATAPSRYTIGYAAGTLMIDPAPLTITASDQSTTYGAVSFDTSTNSMTFAGLVNSEEPGVLGPGLSIVSTVSPNSPAGPYPLTPEGAVDGNYSITYQSGALSVGPAALSITASSPSVTYDASGPPVSPIYAGLANGDSSPASPPACGSTAPANGDVGVYTTSCSGASDPNYAISYTSGTMTITQAATTTFVQAAPNPSVFGQLVTITANVSPVSPGAGNPTGTMEFTDGSSDIAGCAALPVSGRAATCTTTALSVANHQISAVYSGDHNFQSSNGSLAQAVNQAQTTTILGSSPDPSMRHHNVTFTVTLSAVAPGAGTPTGTVTFKDGPTTLGTGVLNGAATASLTINALTIGAHSITASYSGDGSFASSTSPTITQYVDTDLSGYPKLPNGAYDLTGTNLSGGYFAHLALVGADLTGSNFTGAIFSSADLAGANLSNSTFTGDTFTGATLTNTAMSNSNFKAADFTDANLTGASLTASNLATATWNSSVCPDGTDSNNDGGSCQGHL
jgi:hypothetical protein